MPKKSIVDQAKVVLDKSVRFVKERAGAVRRKVKAIASDASKSGKRAMKRVRGRGV